MKFDFSKLVALGISVMLKISTPLTASAEPFAGTYPIKIVATTGMIGDVAQNIGGDLLKVTPLIQSGADPHLYKASPQDLLELVRADYIFFNGLFLEGKMAEVLTKYAEKKKAVAVGEKLPENVLIRAGQMEKIYDPHVWMDVRQWIKVGEGIRDSLVEFDPKNAARYKAGATNYLGQLTSLHQYATSVLGTIPKENRVLVTAHDAFQYFGRSYDIAVRGIQGISTDSEAGLKDINLLVDFIVTKKIPAIFVESTIAPKNVEALVEGAKSKGFEITIGGTLFSDALGSANTRAGTYIGMIESNVNTITKALGGTVPEKGFVTLEDIRSQAEGK